MHRFRLFSIIVFLLAISIGLNACSSSPSIHTDMPPTASGVDLQTELLKITSLEGYLDDYNYWHFVGLLSNDSQQTVSAVEIEVEIFDNTGATLYKDTVSSMVSTVAPGETTPFDLWIFEPLANLNHYTATVIGYHPSDAERAVVEISNISQVVDIYDTIYLTGEVVNRGSQPVDVKGLAATLYDTQGNLVTAGHVEVIRHHLEPDESGPFRINLYAPRALINALTDYQFHPDVQVAKSAGQFMGTISDFSNFIDASGSFHLFGAYTNSSDKRLSVSLVAGLYDADGRVLDAAATSLPVSSIAPGETIPLTFDAWGPTSFTLDGYNRAAEYSIDVDYYQTVETSTNVVDIATKNDANTFARGEARFFGEVLNNSGSDLSSATVIVALYKAGTDQLLATSYCKIEEDITKNRGVPYEVTIYLPASFDPATMEYVLIAKGELP